MTVTFRLAVFGLMLAICVALLASMSNRLIRNTFRKDEPSVDLPPFNESSYIDSGLRNSRRATPLPVQQQPPPTSLGRPQSIVSAKQPSNTANGDTSPSVSHPNAASTVIRDSVTSVVSDVVQGALRKTIGDAVHDFLSNSAGVGAERTKSGLLEEVERVMDAEESATKGDAVNGGDGLLEWQGNPGQSGAGGENLADHTGLTDKTKVSTEATLRSSSAPSRTPTRDGGRTHAAVRHDTPVHSRRIPSQARADGGARRSLDGARTVRVMSRAATQPRASQPAPTRQPAPTAPPTQQLRGQQQQSKQQKPKQPQPSQRRAPSSPSTHPTHTDTGLRSDKHADTLSLRSRIRAKRLKRWSQPVRGNSARSRRRRQKQARRYKKEMERNKKQKERAEHKAAAAELDKEREGKLKTALHGEAHANVLNYNSDSSRTQHLRRRQRYAERRRRQQHRRKPSAAAYTLSLQKCAPGGEWTLHGLWPKDDTCSLRYREKDLEPIMEELVVKWPSCNRVSNTRFWRHEFEKHCVGDMEQLEYFVKSLELRDKYHHLCDTPGSKARRAKNGECRIRLDQYFNVV